MTYNLVFTVYRKQVISQIEVGQDAAYPPHINCLCEGEAEGNFRGPDKERHEPQTRNMLNI